MTKYIATEPSTFRRGRIGPSTGEIWLVIDGIAFPAPHWDDFVIVLLEAWTTALLRIITGVNEVELLHFMDGPYEVEMARAGADALLLRALEREGIERARCQVKIADLLTDLASACDAGLAFCQRTGDASLDAQRLDYALREVRAEHARSRN